jgi:UDP-N-acetylglucosamine 2-epimerase (non-hydrolysing)
MLDQVLEFFDIKPDYDLNIMISNQGLTCVTAAVLKGMEQVFNEWQPDIILVHGDTTTTMAASMAAYYRRISVGHVEAGLRTGNIYSPWPEEVNRRIAAVVASIHFAPTSAAQENLIREGVDQEKILLTGNTVIDALMDTVKRINSDCKLLSGLEEKFSFLHPELRTILVTGHRRENHGAGLENICRALMEIVQENDVQVVYPVHPNPNVQDVIGRLLTGRERIHLISPLDYVSFVYLMQISYIILTDSGGVQEEAPSLGKPVLVMRETTERPEAIERGTAQLVGTEVDRIVGECRRLLNERHTYESMASLLNPYGDGRAAQRIVQHLSLLNVSWFGE